jgi:hypothetical protein
MARVPGRTRRQYLADGSMVAAAREESYRVARSLGYSAEAARIWAPVDDAMEGRLTSCADHLAYVEDCPRCHWVMRRLGG